MAISSAIPAVHSVSSVEASVQFWQSFSADPDNRHRSATLHLAPDAESAAVAPLARSLVVVAPYFVVVVVVETDFALEEVVRVPQLVEPPVVVLAAMPASID